MTYIIIKRELCGHDRSTFVMLPVPGMTSTYVTKLGCPICGLKGYCDTEVDLADALRDLFISDMSFNSKIRHALENC